MPHLKSHHTWHESFRVFHSCSDEKLKIGRALQETIELHMSRTYQFGWIDVGAGDCTQLLVASAEFPNLSGMFLFDPNWYDNFSPASEAVHRLLARGRSLHLFPVEFTHNTVGLPNEPCVLTAIHSLFDEDIAVTVGEVVQEFQKNSRVRLAMIAAEHDSSFIAQCRGHLRSKGIAAPRAVDGYALTPLSAARLNVESRMVSDQFLFCGDPLEEGSAWLPPFICGETQQAFKRRALDEQELVRSTIASVWRAFGGDPVPIPDNLWVIRRSSL